MEPSKQRLGYHVKSYIESREEVVRVMHAINWRKDKVLFVPADLLRRQTSSSQILHIFRPTMNMQSPMG